MDVVPSSHPLGQFERIFQPSVIPSRQDSLTSCYVCFNMKVPYANGPCIIIIMLQGGAWSGLLLFGYLILSRKLSSVFPKDPMTIEQLGQVFENLKPKQSTANVN